jgi:hypothetical protein
MRPQSAAFLAPFDAPAAQKMDFLAHFDAPCPEKTVFSPLPRSPYPSPAAKLPSIEEVGISKLITKRSHTKKKGTASRFTKPAPHLSIPILTFFTAMPEVRTCKPTQQADDERQRRSGVKPRVLEPWVMAQAKDEPQEGSVPHRRTQPTPGLGPVGPRKPRVGATAGLNYSSPLGLMLRAFRYQ